MPSTVILGAQWGDEGKGKLVDYFCDRFDLVVRYQGGNNAGHTVQVGDTTYKMHLLPSGVIRGKRSLIASGVVVDPRVLKEEIDFFSGHRLPVGPDVLGVDFRAHIIMPWHTYWDAARESGTHKIGTTGRGIGPVYESKAARFGVRFEDLVNPHLLMTALERYYPIHARTLKEIFGVTKLPSLEATFKQYCTLGEHFKPYLCDASIEIDEALQRDKNVLFEGAQATLLDNNFGTYPYVTSSQPIAANAAASAGINPRLITRVEAVVKAYATRVGEGPFPTELTDALGERLRKRGNEYGTTTGRPRRVGWLDLTALELGNRLNGYDGMHITKLDVLAGINELKVCTAYQVGSKRITYFPTQREQVEKAVPVFETLDGFGEADWDDACHDSKARGFDALPKNARKYVEFIEKKSGLPVLSVSVGPGREQILLRGATP
ncbi:adenylosuccinate synthase [Candidatus Micrarchaeota archaeon]|nr:adenylosuccinate synthase [Candidatus Micrarchaeota archaeon]